jgi:hypothetical protein
VTAADDTAGGEAVGDALASSGDWRMRSMTYAVPAAPAATTSKAMRHRAIVCRVGFIAPWLIIRAGLLPPVYRLASGLSG